MVGKNSQTLNVYVGQFKAQLYQMSHVMRKPDYAICEQQRRRSDYVVRWLDSIISLLAKAEISRPYLVSVAEQSGLSLTWSQTPKTGFLVTWLK